jgi:hypothetical protein
LPPAPPIGGVAGPPTAFVGSTDRTVLDEELYHPRYSRGSGSAVPYMAGALVLMLAAWWAMVWSTPTASATDPVRSSEWWTNITAVLLPAEDVRLASYSQTRMWVALVLLVLAATAIVLWIGRIGSNIRQGHRPFGAFVAIVAFPAWWILPLSIGITAGGGRSRGDLVVRFLTAFGILFAQFLLMRWPTLNRIWRAGQLPYDPASILLWLPMMIPWMMFFASSAFSLIVLEKGDLPSDSIWRPTPAMLDWARATTRVTSVGIVILLVVVTVVQHIGLAKDRAALDASRERSRQDRMPLLPPGA